MQLKIVHENHVRISKGEELTINMLIEELNECQTVLKKPLKESDKTILERHIGSLKLLIKIHKNEKKKMN